MSLDFNSLFRDDTLDSACPECNSSISFKLSDIGSVIVCPNCKVEIKLNADDGFNESIDSLDSSLSDLENILAKLDK
ncbi:hypothetical protein [[Clostridium] dakarense]|uniref:hypothetical protein n=1 Tax=Faecalimicrobium dakarense TaxID=1301100 RepID=UPI0004B1ED31|nr:hypothetical protein [[Clostridium] dakarense]